MSRITDSVNDDAFFEACNPEPLMTEAAYPRSGRPTRDGRAA
jgi:hypothetical protein